MEAQVNATAHQLRSASLQDSAVKAEDVINICKICQQMLASPVSFKRPEYGEAAQSIWGNSKVEPLAKYHSQDNIQQYIQKGCPLCFQIDYIISKVKGYGHLADDLESIWQDIKIRQEMCYRNTAQSVYSPRLERTLYLKIPQTQDDEVISIRNVASPETIPRAWFQPPSDVESTASIDIKPWYETCLRDHQCEKDRTKEGNNWYLPPRLLSYNDSSLRLIETSELTPNGTFPRYACLSYSWGFGANHLRLSTKNIKLYKSGIPLDDLPTTFGDTIKIARKLSIPYIWIDSLCIIQSGDEEVDRHHQLKQMDKIYANCVLQIAAAHSVDARGGCFSTRHRSSAYPAVLPPPTLELSDDLPKGMLKGLLEVSLHVGVAIPDSVPLMEFYLSSRGWVYQERLLSPRTLHFDKNDVYWECHEHVFSSMFPKKDAVSEEIRLKHTSHLDRRPYDWRCGQGFTVTSYEYGQRVETYSNCNLTNLNDHLVAFSALARRICTMYKDDYLAGFPVSLLPRALCWRRDPSAGIKPIPKYYIAPSWSWASIFEPVIFPNWPKSSSAGCTIITTNVIPNPRNVDDKFGEIIFASITLKSLVLSVSIKLGNVDKFKLNQSVLSVEAVQTDILNGINVSPRHFYLQEFSVVLDRRTENLTLEDFNKWTYLVIEAGTLKNLSRDKRYRGIVLQEAEGGNWVRIGFWELMFTDDAEESQILPLTAGFESKQFTVI
jgi:hypothetical protein